jgi:hypothetical protein
VDELLQRGIQEMIGMNEMVSVWIEMNVTLGMMNLDEVEGEKKMVRMEEGDILVLEMIMREGEYGRLMLLENMVEERKVYLMEVVREEEPGIPVRASGDVVGDLHHFSISAAFASG